MNGLAASLAQARKVQAALKQEFAARVDAMNCPPAKLDAA
jgi:hypothetical protein